MLRFGCAIPLVVLIFLVCMISDSHTLLMLFDAPPFFLSVLFHFCHRLLFFSFVRSLDSLFLTQFSTHNTSSSKHLAVWHQAAAAMANMLRLHRNRL